MSFCSLSFFDIGHPQLNFQIVSFMIIYAYLLFLPPTVSKLLWSLLFIVILSIQLYLTSILHSNTNILEELMFKLRKQHMGNCRSGWYMAIKIGFLFSFLAEGYLSYLGNSQSLFFFLHLYLMAIQLLYFTFAYVTA